MNVTLFVTVLEIVAPIFLLAAIGFLWVKLGFEYRMEFVTRLAMGLSLPCLLFVALMNSEIEPAALTTVSIAASVCYLVLTLLFFGMAKLTKMNVRTYVAPLTYGNTGNLGLPLALFAFGESGLSYAVVIFAVSLIWTFTHGVWLVSGGGSVARLLREPLVFGTVLGAVFLWQGWTTPVFLTRSLELIGQIGIPLMLITLGVAVARLRPADFGVSVLLSLLKIAVCVAVAVAVAMAFNLDNTPFAVLVVQICTPVAVTSYLVAVRHEADSEAVAGLVVVSTMLSVVTLPILLAFFL